MACAYTSPLDFLGLTTSDIVTPEKAKKKTKAKAVPKQRLASNSTAAFEDVGSKVCAPRPCLREAEPEMSSTERWAILKQNKDNQKTRHGTALRSDADLHGKANLFDKGGFCESTLGLDIKGDIIKTTADVNTQDDDGRNMSVQMSQNPAKDTDSSYCWMLKFPNSFFGKGKHGKWTRIRDAHVHFEKDRVVVEAHDRSGSVSLALCTDLPQHLDAGTCTYKVDPEGNYVELTVYCHKSPHTSSDDVKKPWKKDESLFEDDVKKSSNKDDGYKTTGLTECIKKPSVYTGKCDDKMVKPHGSGLTAAARSFI